MMIAAVISEFDPFHNGHKYLIEETRRRTGCDGVVCIMSGSFTQRGRPAVCDKWARAEMALKAGADAVIELPFLYAVSSAQFFALGGITLCKAIKADVLSFGIESDEESVYKFAEKRCGEDYSQILLRGIEAGGSYVSSASDAIGDGRLKPNDILACEYIAAAEQKEYRPQLLMIKRAGAGHGSEEASGGFASASLLRSMLQEDGWKELVRPFVPETTLEILEHWRSAGQFVTADSFSSALCVKLRTTSAKRIESLPFGGGGVGQLLYNRAQRFNSWDQIVSSCTSARYPSSRISRLMVHALTDGDEADSLSQEEREQIYFEGSAPYVRVLGVSSGCEKSGKLSILSELSKRCAGNAALVTAPHDYFDNDLTGAKMLKADIRAQSVYNSVLSDAKRQAGDRDLTQKLLRMGGNG